MNVSDNIKPLNISDISAMGKKRLFDDANKYMEMPYPYLLATDYMEFSRTGNRTNFEDKYFLKRYMINSLILSYITGIKADDAVLDKIINGLVSICEESGWQLPPHNSYPDSYGNAPVPDVSRPVLDLFACETGALLSFASFLLKDKLDKETTYIRKRLAYEVYNRIIRPYITNYEWWMGDRPEGMCNWTPWCTQNVLIAARFYEGLLSDELLLIYKKAYKSIKLFIESYKEDGCCDEGALYYRHAGLCLFLSLEFLESKYSPLKSCEDKENYPSLYEKYPDKIKNIAEYIVYMRVNEKYYFNFSDCSPNPGPCTVREFLFGKRVGSGVLCDNAYNDYFFDKDANYVLPNEINLFYRYLALQYEKEMGSYEKSNEKTKEYIYYESTQLSVFNYGLLSLATKGGNNAESHNHNDTGSFSAYKDNKQAFIDLGVESYTKTTFSNDRYSLWTMQSCFHNLPTIAGFDEADGKRYCATNHETNSDSVKMDLANAYNQNCPVERFVRKFNINKDDATFTFYDEFKISDDSANKEILENLMVSSTPLNKDGKSLKETTEITDDEYLIKLENGISFTVCGVSSLITEKYDITDERLKKSYDTVYRLRFKLKENRFKLTLL